MTPFQRAALSVVTHAWCKEFDKPDQKITNRLVTVSSRNNKYVFNFRIYELSYSSVDMMDASSYLKFYSEKMEKNRYIFVPEDNKYLRISVFEKDRQYLRGLDGSDYRFESRVYDWQEVLIDDNENIRSSPFLYRLKW